MRSQYLCFYKASPIILACRQHKVALLEGTSHCSPSIIILNHLLGSPSLIRAIVTRPLPDSLAHGSTDAGAFYTYSCHRSQNGLHHLSLWLLFSPSRMVVLNFGITGAFQVPASRLQATPINHHLWGWEPGMNVAKKRPRLRINILGPAVSFYDHHI